MLIRSQNKKVIVNFDNITEIFLKVILNEYEIKKHLKTGVAYSCGEKSSCVLGFYSSEEKAIKVLDMIQEAYLEPTYISCYSDLEFAKHEYKVFQMPLEDDVIIDD